MIVSYATISLIYYKKAGLKETVKRRIAFYNIIIYTRLPVPPYLYVRIKNDPPSDDLSDNNKPSDNNGRNSNKPFPKLFKYLNSSILPPLLTG